jgi:O-succinylbenzoate synthase
MGDPIERVTLTHIQIPYKEALSLRHGNESIKNAVVVQLHTRDGLTAVGEASPTAAQVDRVWSDLTERIGPTLPGRALSSIDGIQQITSAWDGENRTARAGAETALWDLVGQATHQSLAGLLGASETRILDGVESGLAVGLYPTVVDLLRAIEPHLDEGYRRVKLKIAPDRDLDLIRAVRDHFGEDLPLMVDGQGAYRREDLPIFQRMEDFTLLMIEQPLPPDDLDGMAEWQSRLLTPLCLDEGATTPKQTAFALDRGAARIVNLKLQRVGGFGPARAIHDVCATRDVACWVGTTPELGIGQAGGLHLATLNDCRYPSDVEPSARWFMDDYVTPRLELAAPGRFTVPTRPGVGLQVDPVKLRRYAVRDQTFTLR